MANYSVIEAALLWKYVDDVITLPEILCAKSNVNLQLKTDLYNLGAWCAENAAKAWEVPDYM